MKVLCIGKSCIEEILYFDGFPKEGINCNSKGMIISPGGFGVISSLLLSKWGVNTYLNSTIGNDTNGDIIINTLKDNNVNIENVFRDNETVVSHILVNKYNYSKTLISDSVVNSNKKFDIEDIDIILMDASYYDVCQKICSKLKKAIKVVYVREVSNDTIKMCKLSDYIICSKGFAEVASKKRIDYNVPDSLKEVVNLLEEMYNSKVVITLGSKGCLYKIKDKIKVMGSIKVNSIDTCGVGEIFSAAFTYGLSENLELEKCLKIATIASGLSTKVSGSVTSIPDVREVHKIYAKNK
mgnify:FL=1